MSMPAGRPSGYNENIAARILAEIATRNVGLKTICDDNKDFPSPSTVYLWLMQHEEFRDKYARAKEDQTQVLEDEMLILADNTKLGEIVTIKGDGTEEIKRSDMIEHRKLQIETRKWLMGKLKPKKYGDKIQQEVTGKDGGPLQIISSVPRPDYGEDK
jgi:hypothetical protein